MQQVLSLLGFLAAAVAAWQVFRALRRGAARLRALAARSRGVAPRAPERTLGA